MNDPYEVLGVPRDSLDDQIKAAYRKLVKKYHPDNYAGTNLSEVANEKMQQVNEAYDTIMNERKRGNSSSSQTSGNSYYNKSTSYQSGSKHSSKYAYIRSYIYSNRLIQAEEELNKIPENERDAEWHFLKGSMFFSRGWLEDATAQFETAYRMEPSNNEYRATYNRMMWQRQGNMGTPYGGSPYRSPRGAGGCSACDLCCGLMCADSCCECMGGDLISCC